jgi:hypothetical protein
MVLSDKAFELEDPISNPLPQPLSQTSPLQVPVPGDKHQTKSSFPLSILQSIFFPTITDHYLHLINNPASHCLPDFSMAEQNTPTGAMDSDTDSMYTTPVERPARTALHEDKEASAYVLKTPTESVPLQIGASAIASPGSGLFAEKRIEECRQIFRSKPLIACVDSRVVSVCHYCLEDSTTGIPSQRRRKAPPSLCSGCKIARFCSKVCFSSMALAHSEAHIIQDCQAKAWKIFHKDECKVLRENPTISHTHLALYRILFWQNRKHLPTKVGKVLSLLEDHFPDHSETGNADDLYKTAQSIRSTSNSNVALHVLWKLLTAVSFCPLMS